MILDNNFDKKCYFLGHYKNQTIESARVYTGKIYISTKVIAKIV